MIGKARAGGDSKVVEHEEGGKVAEMHGANRPPHPRARALGLLDREERLLDLARRRCSEWLVGDDGEAPERGAAVGGHGAGEERMCDGPDFAGELCEAREHVLVVVAGNDDGSNDDEGGQKRFHGDKAAYLYSALGCNREGSRWECNSMQTRAVMMLARRRLASNTTKAYVRRC